MVRDTGTPPMVSTLDVDLRPGSGLGIFELGSYHKLSNSPMATNFNLVLNVLFRFFPLVSY